MEPIEPNTNQNGMSEAEREEEMLAERFGQFFMESEMMDFVTEDDDD